MFPILFKPKQGEMRKVFLSAGHSSKKNGDRGAVSNGYVEGDLTIELRDLIVIELKALGVDCMIDANENALAETMRYFKAFTNKDALLVDIHFNAAGPDATGVEVVIPNDANDLEKKVAQEILTAIYGVIPIKNRGVITEGNTARKKLGWMRLIGNNVLIETCFISNRKDMLLYNANKKGVAKAIAKAIKNNL